MAGNREALVGVLIEVARLICMVLISFLGGGDLGTILSKVFAVTDYFMCKG